MLCKIYSIILVLISTTTMISIVVVQRKQLLAHAEAAQQQREQQQQQQHHDQQLHPPLLVDTKYWIKNTEFGERDNWRLHLKPCTLIERIQINERAVISMGDSLDALGGSLESNIRELVLPVDGILLLEEDTLNDSLDPMFVQYLNQSGDCFESSDLNYETGAGDGRFHFEPHSDDMSWFNPANWASSLNEDEIADWVPESHLVPCSEDIVVFGSRHATLTPVIESNERAQLISFKINFRPSQMMQEQLSNISLPDGIRVSKLKIGEQTYNQQEFEQLINSNFYKNILFELSDNRSVLRSDSGIEYNPAHSLITIDETSIQADSSYGLCLDEAGCLCGNEDANVMQIICSFNYPLEPDLLPCYDPIQASGYCNKICATVLTITMDPTKFSERFLANVMNKKLEDDELFKHLNDNVFMGARRVDHNKYEVTFRPVPSDSKSYEMTLGTEIELAQLFRQHLENAATKSFYGIKTVKIKSSVDWRRNNRDKVFWISMVFLLPFATSIFAYHEGLKLYGASPASILRNCWQQVRNWFRLSEFRSSSADETSILAENGSIANQTDLNESYNSVSEIVLVELDSTMDTSSTSDPLG